MSARKVFGRRRLELEAEQLQAEMRADGVWLKRLRARHSLHLSWARLWNMAIGQGELLFSEPVEVRRLRGRRAQRKQTEGAA